MPESRNIVVILGNGFDLDLGLKTSYKDFWESEFCPIDYPAPIIRHLNSRWVTDREAVRWYDLENELLNYALHGDKMDVINESESEYIKENNDFSLCNKLRFLGVDDTFRTLVDKGIIIKDINSLVMSVTVPFREAFDMPVLLRDKYAFNLIKEGLCNYLRSLQSSVADSRSAAFLLLCALTKCVQAGNTVSIYSFNYTPVQMRGISLDGISVRYMHGSCGDGSVIVGTREDSSISREYDFLQKIMDDSFSPPDIVSALMHADEVIVFGHSLGENDRQYFENFFTKQASGEPPTKAEVFIFTRDTNSKKDIKRALQSMINGSSLSTLYSVNQPYIIKTGEIAKDQRLFYDFMIKHHCDKRYASEAIGKLLD